MSQAAQPIGQTTSLVEPKNGFGITALALALVGLVFGMIPLTGFVALILGALAILFGLLGVGRVRHGRATNKKMSWIGTVLGIGSLALGIWGVVIVFQATNDFVNDMNEVTRDLENIPPPPNINGMELKGL